LLLSVQYSTLGTRIFSFLYGGQQRQQRHQLSFDRPSSVGVQCSSFNELPISLVWWQRQSQSCVLVAQAYSSMEFDGWCTVRSSTDSTFLASSHMPINGSPSRRDMPDICNEGLHASHTANHTNHTNHTKSSFQFDFHFDSRVRQGQLPSGESRCHASYSCKPCAEIPRPKRTLADLGAWPHPETCCCDLRARCGCGDERSRWGANR
jgi:hypothetical protein